MKFYYVSPTGSKIFKCGRKIELIESEKRNMFGGGQVKGSKVESRRMKKGENKAYGVFPSGHGITFHCNTIHTLQTGETRSERL